MTVEVKALAADEASNSHVRYQFHNGKQDLQTKHGFAFFAHQLKLTNEYESGCVWFATTLKY